MNYVATKLKQALFVNGVISIHYFEYTSEFRYSGESHDFWELIYCDKGTLKINAGNNEFILEHGQAFLHPPRQFHNVRADRERAANSIILSFESDTAELYGIADKIINTDPYVANALFSVLREAKLSFSNPLGLVHDEQLIRKNERAPFASEQIIQNYIELLLIHVIRQAKNSLPFPELPPSVPQSSLLDEMLAYMKEHLGEKITFETLTKVFSVSPTTLKKLFSNAFEHGAMEQLTRMRIAHSKELLREGQLSCTDIAALCGFCSVHHYSNVFKKYESMSPTEYKKSIKAMLEYGTSDSAQAF